MRDVHERRKPEDHACRHGHGKREEQHERIDGHLARTRQAGRIGARAAPARRRRASSKPERAACQRQQHTFGHELPEQPSAAGAERRAHGKFAMARFGAGQQQVRQIRAGDEQHEADGDLQHPDRLTGLAKDLRPAAAAICRMWPPLFRAAE